MDKQLYLFFDTETTGLPKNYDTPSSDLLNWPRLVQISWIVSDSNGVVVSKENHIIKPKDYVIPDKVAKLHGITTERALEIGEKIEVVLHHFWTDVQNASYIIGHNVSFDENVVEAEFYRLGEHNVFLSKHSICTKLVSTDYCKIPSKWKYGEYKWPTLQELYNILFGKDLIDAHDSEADVQATFECFWKLKDLGIISGLEIEEGIISTANEFTSAKGMNFTTFAFNAVDYYGYGTSTSTLKLSGQDWNLFAEGIEPQTLLFGFDKKAHLMIKGKGIPGSYDLKDRNSILLSFGEECYYLHCVYYNTDIVILRFDQSNNHILLSRKDIIFHSVEEIRGYLTNVRHEIDLKRDEARKLTAINQEKRIKELIDDICRTGVEASDARVESLKRKFKELSLIIGTERAAEYQSHVDNAIKENQERKDRIAEELRKKAEERQRQKEIKKDMYMVRVAVFAIFSLFICIWSIALNLHLNEKWDNCQNLLGWSAYVTFFGAIPVPVLTFIFCVWKEETTFGSYIKERITYIIVYIFFSCFTIFSCFVYDDDLRKFWNCFSDSQREERYSVDNFSLSGGNKYLCGTKFHFFETKVKTLFERKINSSYDLYELSEYLRDNGSGFYVREVNEQFNHAADILFSQAKTLGDWEYLIRYAPQKYKTIAEKNYKHLDSYVWNYENLAYENAKSLRTMEAYDIYLSKNFNNDAHRLEIEELKDEEIRMSNLMSEIQKNIKKDKRSK